MTRKSNTCFPTPPHQERTMNKRTLTLTFKFTTQLLASLKYTSLPASTICMTTNTSNNNKKNVVCLLPPPQLSISAFFPSLYLASHFRNIRCLCLRKCSSETLQNLPYIIGIWKVKTHVVFSLMNALVYKYIIYIDIDQGIHKGKK